MPYANHDRTSALPVDGTRNRLWSYTSRVYYVRRAITVTRKWTKAMIEEITEPCLELDIEIVDFDEPTVYMSETMLIRMLYMERRIRDYIGPIDNDNGF